MNITVWNEHVHEREGGEAARIYPDGIHGTIAAALTDVGSVGTATLAEPEHGLNQAVLDATDVLLWWGHEAHADVGDDVVTRVVERVHAGMGLVVLHSGHDSKPFKLLMGTPCTLAWRHDECETVWTVAPGHPIAAGLPPSFVIPQHEMYGEFFDVPQPEHLVFVSSFTGGEVFRSGCCWTRGRGRIFYFSPGHETNPVYHQAEVQRVLANATRWASAA